MQSYCHHQGSVYTLLIQSYSDYNKNNNNILHMIEYSQDLGTTKMRPLMSGNYHILLRM